MRLLVLSLALLVGLPGAALAQERLLHEFVEPSFLRNHRPAASGGTEIEGGDPLPSAVKRDGTRLEAPGADDSDTPSMDPEAPDRIPRPDEARPDRKTTQDQALTYHAVFNPSVAPLRRNVTFDLVKDDYGLAIAPGPRQPVPLAARAPVPGREMFWGDVKLALGSGPAPLPSVAPDMRIMAVQATPEVPVRFSKDGADNYYVESPHKGTVRIVFLVDAPSSYFAAPVARNVPLDTQADHPATQLPEKIRQEAQGVLVQLGISRGMAFDAGLNRLIRWFRDFEAGAPPPKQGSIFVDLALGRKGVCRHRAFAFTLAARAAGIPTRQVQNEAHAFVEILAPDGAWRRVDLGGEAPSVDFKNGQDHRLHQPPPDAFDKPERYAAQYSAQLQGVGQGADGRGGNAVIGDRPPPLDASGRRPGADGARDGAGDGPMSDFEGPAPEVPLPPVDPQDPTDPSAPPAVSAPNARAVHIAVEPDGGRFDAYRGEALPFDVAGRLDAEGAPVAGVKVQVYLLADGGDPRPVGRAVATGPDGRFRARVTLPPTLVLGQYRLIVASEASSAFLPARSDQRGQ